MERLITFIDRFVPASLDRSEKDALRRMRLCIAGAWLILSSQIVGLVYSYLIDLWIPFIAIIPTCFVLTLVPFLLKRRWSLVLCGNLISASLFFVIAIIAYYDRGVETPILMANAAVCLIAILLAGPRWGVFWILMSWIEDVFLLTLSYLYHPFPQMLQPQEEAFNSALVVAVLVTVCGALGLIYESLKGTAFTELEQTALALDKARQAAETASKTKSKFLANMSHEIRTPLNGILGIVEILRRTDLTAVQQQYVETLQDSGQALCHLLNNLLDLRKMEESKLELDINTFDLEALLISIAHAMIGASREKQLDLYLDIDPALPSTFKGDVGRLRQVFTNLMSNAIKFTEEGFVKLTLSGQIEGPQSQLVFKLEDSGIGISPENQLKIFESFTQGERSTGQIYGGSGLGLAICCQLLDVMNGDIQVSSQKNQGSTFTIKLSLPHINEQERSSPLAHQHVVLLSDNDVNQGIFERILKNSKLSLSILPFTTAALPKLSTLMESGDKILACIIDFRDDHKHRAFIEASIDHWSDFTPPQLIWYAYSPPDFQFDKPYHFLPKPLGGTMLMSTLEGLVAKERSPVTHARVPEIKSERILIVEDNPTNQLIIQTLLEQLGYQTKLANNGAEALQVFEVNSYDLIIMDCRMPVMDGLETTRKIRARERGTRIPVVALSAGIMNYEKEQCLEAGMDAFLAKPLVVKDLEAVLARFLSSSK
jgi:signal transduction histidine kinase/CheY-like chemotaxis protein